MGRYGNQTGARKDPNRQNYINHVGLAIDGSSSIQTRGLTPKMIKVVDNLVAFLAKRSVELNQETRVTVYIFADEPECVIFDKDVLRLPSLAEIYEPYGNTALLDATKLSIDDMRETMTKYGDHAFLTYVITDGEENQSYRITRTAFAVMLNNLRENETVAALVPDERGVRMARQFGFPEGNITMWEVSEAGLEAAGTTITRSADTFMTNRPMGIRSTKGVFTTDTTAVNKETVNSKNLVKLPRSKYSLLDIKHNAATYKIREWVEAQLDEHDQPRKYEIGKGYYQLTKPETIQASKGVALQNIHSGVVYSGQQARDILNLPNVDARVKPDQNDKYRIFVQSTSVNRNLIPGTKILLMK